MDFDRSWLEARGFGGFATVREVRDGARLPAEAGVYVVLWEQAGRPRFIDKSPCGDFKGRDPTVPLDDLKRRWLDGCETIYIGRSKDLRKRWRTRLAFAAGRRAGAWGGRRMWQLQRALDLVVGFRVCHPGEEVALERELLARFREQWGRPPFANDR